MDNSMAMARVLLTERVIAFHPVIAKITTDVKAALFFCQLMYWSDKGEDSRGWIWKTRDQWQDETGLTRREQETARAKLRGLDLIEEFRRGQPPVMYYRVKWDSLRALLQAHASRAETAQHKGRKAPIAKGGNVPTQRAESALSSIQENTAKITSLYSTEPKTVWIEKLREIEGWHERGFQHEDTLILWAMDKGHTDDDLMDAAIGVGSQATKNLKTCRNLAQKFQVAVNKGYYRDRRPDFKKQRVNGVAPVNGHNDEIMRQIKERKAAKVG